MPDCPNIGDERVGDGALWNGAYWVVREGAVGRRRCRVNRLVMRSAEKEALELDARGEKWAALTIVALLAIIEDLTGERVPSA